MTTLDYIQVIIFFVLIIVLTPIIGNFMFKVFTGKKHIMLPVFGWLEKLTYKFIKVKPDEESNWKSYTFGMLMFNLIGFLFLFLIQLFQSYLPLNPAHFPNVSWHMAFNTAVSFMTNTNWQSYSGETTLSYFVQMLGLTVQNFVAAATGIAILLALIRGIARKTTDKLGNFWARFNTHNVVCAFAYSYHICCCSGKPGVVQNFRAL